MPNAIYLPSVPELIARWDFDLNRDVDVSTITVGNENIYWWKCEKGHSYPATPDSQRHGQRCTICTGKRVLKGYNDFETWCTTNNKEYLLQEWDYEKNLLAPSEYTPKSGKQVHWKCRFCGNCWLCTINQRTGKNTGCKRCASSRQTSFPEQALIHYVSNIFSDTEVHYKIPNTKYTIDLYIPSLQIGIEYDGYAWHRNTKSQRRENIKNELCTQHNISLIRIKECKSEAPIHFEENVYYYHRDKHDENLSLIIQLILSKTLKVIDIPDINIMRDRSIIENKYYFYSGKNTLAKLCPNLISEWDKTANYPLTPDTISFRSNKAVNWICPKGHHYTMTVDKRSQGRGCTYCNCTSTILPGFNDFETFCIENNKEYLLREWDYEKNLSRPSEHKHGENSEYYWKCPKCSNQWRATIVSRSHGYKNCPNCYISKRSKRVVALNDTGQDKTVYTSITEAATIMQCNQQTLRSYIGSKKRYLGYYWDFYTGS